MILTMRKVLRLVWMALVLLTVALLSALTSMRFAIHGREVAVPDFQGKTPAEAHRLAEEVGVLAQVENNYYSEKTPEGRILSQVPAAGTQVRRGWEVRLALSLGPQRVTIPQVVGESERAATISIAQRGLELSSSATLRLAGTSSGQVVAQDPPANAKDVSAPKINLLVAGENSPQAFVMPSFIGQPLGSVTNTLQAAGFSVGRVTMAAPAEGQEPPAAPAASPASVIVGQDPAAGQKVLAGSAINFIVR
jgi:beta-lactam-binding protein with PASTA domain